MQGITEANTSGGGNIGGMNGDELFTHKEAAAFLRCSSPTLYGWVSKGMITPLKAGNLNLYRKSDLIRFLEECGQEAAQKRAAKKAEKAELNG
ncbi:MAG: helix-turn-helix domain-containing protein [Desulfobaccales bacterium]